MRLSSRRQQNEHLSILEDVLVSQIETLMFAVETRVNMNGQNARPDRDLFACIAFAIAITIAWISNNIIVIVHTEWCI